MAMKRDGNPRFHVDYRTLNRLMKDERFPITLIVEIFDDFSGVVYAARLVYLILTGTDAWRREGYDEVRVELRDLPIWGDVLPTHEHASKFPKIYRWGIKGAPIGSSQNWDETWLKPNCLSSVACGSWLAWCWWWCSLFSARLARPMACQMHFEML